MLYLDNYFVASVKLNFARDRLTVLMTKINFNLSPILTMNSLYVKHQRNSSNQLTFHLSNYTHLGKFSRAIFQNKSKFLPWQLINGLECTVQNILMSLNTLLELHMKSKQQVGYQQNLLLKKEKLSPLKHFIQQQIFMKMTISVGREKRKGA